MVQWKIIHKQEESNTTLIKAIRVVYNNSKGTYAVVESFFKTLKVECVYQNKFTTKKQVELAVFEYIETWYNRNRRHSALSGLTILEFENLIKRKHAA